MPMRSWMEEIASHYEKVRRQHPDSRLTILFDIDGTILDVRYMAPRVLPAYDRAHNTQFFRELRVPDIEVHENQVDHLLGELKIPSEERKETPDWCNERR